MTEEEFIKALDMLDAVEKEATPAPWHIGHVSEFDDSAAIDSPELICVGRINTRSDQNFVCHSRNLARPMIDRIRMHENVRPSYNELVRRQSEWGDAVIQNIELKKRIAQLDHALKEIADLSPLREHERRKIARDALEGR